MRGAFKNGRSRVPLGDSLPAREKSNGEELRSHSVGWDEAAFQGSKKNELGWVPTRLWGRRGKMRRKKK